MGAPLGAGCLGFLFRFADLGEPFGGIGIMRPHCFLNGVRVAREERLIHAVVPLKKLLRRVQRTPLLKHKVFGNHPAGTAGNGDERLLALSRIVSWKAVPSAA